MDHRRLGAASAGALSVLLLAGCARYQDAYPHGEEAESWTNGSVARTVLLYVGIPLLIMVVTAVLAWVPEMRRSSRYRPREGWSADPVWFAGPADPADAVENAQSGDTPRGGAGGTW